MSAIIDLTGIKTSHGGPFGRGEPQGGAAHCLQAPDRAGLAVELGRGWVPNSGVSPHYISDRRESARILDSSIVGWHVGGGNPHCVGFEVTGYAEWSRAQWLTQIDALRNQAQCMALEAARWGWELRWLSLAEIARGVKGFWTHNDARLVWGGTTHTDPGDGYPYDVVMKMVQQWSGETVTAPDTPNPQPADGPGGAQADWFDMATKQDLIEALLDPRVLEAIAVTVWTKTITDRRANDLLNSAALNAEKALRGIGDLPVNVWLQPITDDSPQGRANHLLSVAASPKD